MMEDRVPHKRLESIGGFIIYVARTYKWMMPYLKGLHLPFMDGERDVTKTSIKLIANRGYV